MLVCLMMMLLPQQSNPTVTPMNGIMNGDFEYLLDPAAKLDPPNGQHRVDGGFWVGAEALTETEPNNRFLTLEARNGMFDNALNIPETVYQRVGCVQEHTRDTELEWSVRVHNDTDEARITVGEATGTVHSLEWWLTKKEEDRGPQWSLWIDSPDPAAPPGVHRFPSTGGNHLAYGNHTTFNSTVIQPDTTIWAVWTAERAGWVRIVMRPRRWDDPCIISTPSNPCVLDTDIFHDADGFNSGLPGGSIGESEVPDTETEGVVRILRHWVDDGDQLVFELANTNSANIPNIQKHTLNWSPYIIEEARRVVYRFGASLQPISPDGTTLYEDISISSGSWTDSSTLGSLDFGTDFFGAFGVNPTPPLEVVLEAKNDNIFGVDFDEIECNVGFDKFTESDLRKEILAEAALVRARQRRNIDGQDNSVGSNLGVTGAFETPYMFPYQYLHTWGSILGQPTEPYFGDTAGSTFPGAFPKMLVAGMPYHEQHYVEQNHKDWSWLHQQHLRSRSDTGFPFEKYDVRTDTRDMDASNYTSLSTGKSVDAQLKAYELTGDPESLDLAFACAMTMVDNGVVPSGHDTAGLIWYTGYNMQTGEIRDSVFGSIDKYKNHHHVNGLSKVLRTYAACRLYNEEIALLSPPRPERYASLSLDSLLEAGEVAARVATERVNVGYQLGSEYDPAKTWHEKPNVFDDLYGYQASDALDAYEALSHFNDTALNPVRDDLKEIFHDGALYWLDLEEQSIARAGFEPGDETRAAIGFLGAVRHTTIDAVQVRIEKLLMRWAFYCLKFQAPGGIWTQGSRESFQILDYSHQYFGPAPIMMPDQAPGLVSRLLGAEATIFNRGLGTKEDLITLLSSYLTVSREHFFGQYDQYPWESRYYMNGWSPYLVKPANDPPVYEPVQSVGGWELRFIAALLEGSLHMPEGLDDAPEVSVTPEDFLPSPTGPVDFEFEVRFHDVAPNDYLSLYIALATRVKIEKWEKPSGSTTGPDKDWKRNELWPAQSGNFITALTLSTSTCTLTLQVDRNTSPKDLKFTVRAWNDDGLWDEATTYQEDW